MKSISGWSVNGNGDNSSGFNALPGGYRSYGQRFSLLGDCAEFWSSSEQGTSAAWDRSLVYDLDDVSRNYFYRSSGFSVRCLRN